MDDNPFVSYLTELAGDLIAIAERGKIREGFTPTRNLHEHEIYFYDCYQGMGSIHTVMRQLDQIAVFLSNFRSTTAMKAKDIHRFDHMVYHMENYLFRVTGVLDRLLIFTNQILKLGLEEESCKPHMMLTSKKGQKGRQTHKIESVPGLYQALDAVRIFVDQYREERNDITHAKRWENIDTRTIEMFHIVLSKSDDPELLKREFLIKRMTDEKMWELKAEMLKSTEELETLVADAFAILRISFDERYLRLKKKINNS